MPLSSLYEKDCPDAEAVLLLCRGWTLLFSAGDQARLQANAPREAG